MQPQDFYLPLGRIENFNPSLRKSKPRENGSYQNLLSSTSQPTLLTTTINHGGGCRPLIIIIYWHASDRIWSIVAAGKGKKQNHIALFWEVISEVRHIYLYTSKRCPKSQIHGNAIFHFLSATLTTSKSRLIWFCLTWLNSSLHACSCVILFALSQRIIYI